jgi:outer membrane receptor for ferrienterochelin and colicins
LKTILIFIFNMEATMSTGLRHRLDSRRDQRPLWLPYALLAAISLGPVAIGRAQSATDSRFSTVVTATRTSQRASESATPIDVIPRAEIERSGARDLAEVLALHPSVQIERSFAGAGVYVQGLEPQHVLILLDGQRMIGRTNGVIDLSRIPVERIEQVEISRGASSVLYGSDALGGVINIVTRSTRRRFETSLQAQYGTLNALDLRGSGGLRFRWGSLTLTSGWHRRDAYRLRSEGLATSGSAFDEQQVSGRLDLRPLSRLRLGASAAYLRRRMDGIDQYETGATLDRTNLTETLDTSLSPEVQLGPVRLRSVLQYSYFRDQYLLDQRRGSQLDSFQETREHLVRGDVQADVLLPRSNLLSVGGELLYERLYTPRLSSGEGSRIRGALFAQDQWRIVKSLGLSLVPALRFDADSQFGHNLAPKLALRIAPWPALMARASYGAGFRAPLFKELLLLFENPGAGYVVQGRLDLRPETSHSVNLGVESTPRPWLTLSLNLFRNELRDLIQPLLLPAAGGPGPQRFSYGNIASAYTQGVEAALRLRSGDTLSLDLNYTLTDAQDAQLGRELDGRPRHRGNLSLTARHPDWGIDVMTRVALIGPRAYHTDDDGDGEVTRIEAPAYVLWDARIELALSRVIGAFLGGQNLLDAGEPRFLPIPPRTLFVGISGRAEAK